MKNRNNICRATLARAAGVSPQHFRNILLGKRRPSSKMAIKLERGTGVHRFSWLYDEPKTIIKKLEALHGRLAR